MTYDDRMKVNKRIAKLTVEEDRFWVKSITFYINAGLSDSQADEKAWQETIKQFPRLKKYDGAKA